MKFHNQRSFMGHEISNVNNKPLLHKKGKQWIVVAISALVLAGFGGMVSTTTHADATAAQPTTTKVAPKPANNSGNASNVMKQAQGMHKALTNNAAVQKPSAPSSAVAKKTTPASAAKSNSVSASSSVSSKASSSVNSASVKSSSVSSNSNSSNNKATKPAVHMMLMSTPAPSVQSGTWGTAHWTLNNSTGSLVISDGDITDTDRPVVVGTEKMNAYKWPSQIDQSNVKTISFKGYVQAPTACEGLFANSSDNADGNWDGTQTYAPKLKNLTSVDLTGLDLNNVKSVKHMFSGDHNLQSIKGLSSTNTNGLYDMSYMFVNDNNLTSVDLSKFNTHTNEWVDNMFDGCSNLNTVNLSNFDTSTVGANNSGAFTNWFHGTHNLSTIILGPNTHIPSSSSTGLNLKTWIHIDNSDNGAQIMNSNMNYKPGTWIAATSEGTWHNASWAMDNNGNLVIQGKTNDNSITSKRSDAQGLIWNNVHNIYTNDVTAPTSLNSTFANLPHLQSIDLSRMNNINSITDMSNLFLNDSDLTNINLGDNFDTSNVTNMSGMFQNDRELPSIQLGNNFDTRNVTHMNNMFAGDWALKSLNLPIQFDTRNANISNMFDSDSDLQTLSLPSDFQNTNNNSSHIFGWNGNTQVPQLNKLTLKSGTYLGNANLPSSWVKSGDSTKQSVSASTLESGNDHAGTWLNTIQTDNVYYVPTYSDAKNHTNIISCDVSPNTSSDPYYNRNDYFQPKGKLNTSDAMIYNKSDSLVNKQPQPINSLWYQWNYNLMPGGWNIRKEEGIPNFKFNGGNYYVPIASDNANEHIQISYKYNGQTVNSLSSNVNDTNFNADDYIPSGYQADNFSSSTSNGSKELLVSILPNQVTDTINYQYNNSTVSTSTFTGNDVVASGASNTSFTVSAPTNYHLATGARSTFSYNGNSYSVSIVPNTVNNTIYYNGNSYSSSANVSGPYSTLSSVSAPSGYHYINGNNGKFTYGANNTSYTFSVAPNPATETIDYMYNNSSEGSTTMSGAYNEKGNVTSTGINSGFHLASATTFNYSNGSATDKVSVVPNSITINYMNGNNKVGSYSANTMTPYTVFNSSIDSASAGSLPASSVTADVNLPAGYSLVKSNSPLSFNNSSYNIKVTPNTKTDTINYMYNSTEISSAKVSGENMYAKYSAFNISTAPAGYSAVSSNFYYDGEPHDVNIKPNEDTDTVNYQVNGSTVASHQFTGNDEHATRAGDNSFDVTANNDSAIPNGYELVNGDNNFSFDNGTHDVAIQPIPQPVPYIPSMPVSSVASASSANSESTVPASNTISHSSNEIKPIHRSRYSHYRYAKIITPLQLHTSKHFTKKNGVLTIKHPTSFKIMKIVRDHKFTRYEVKYQGHNYFITANDHFTINNYVQKHDFKSYKHMMVRVITPLIEYRRLHFGKKYVVRNVRKGTILPVKRVITIGKGEMTRFELTNGRFVTSNKLFVKVIK